MKNKQIIGSKNFWMILAVILGVFILVTGVILICFNSKMQTTSATPFEQTTQVTVQQTLDHSFEATKERVDGVNDNYGQNVKSSYYGNYSTMEQMMQSRIFFGNLKSILMIVLVVMVILLILVKGFNLSIFKKMSAESGNSDCTEPVVTPVQKPRTVSQTSEPKENDVKQTAEQVEDEQSDETVPKTQEEDEQEVADSCQLP